MKVGKSTGPNLDCFGVCRCVTSSQSSNTCVTPAYIMFNIFRVVWTLWLRVSLTSKPPYLDVCKSWYPFVSDLKPIHHSPVNQKTSFNCILKGLQSQKTKLFTCVFQFYKFHSVCNVASCLLWTVFQRMTSSSSVCPTCCSHWPLPFVSKQQARQGRKHHRHHTENLRITYSKSDPASLMDWKEL